MSQVFVDCAFPGFQYTNPSTIWTLVPLHGTPFYPAILLFRDKSYSTKYFQMNTTLRDAFHTYDADTSTTLEPSTYLAK